MTRTAGVTCNRTRLGWRGGINTYSYVYNNPLKYTDPTGKFGLVAGAAVGTVAIVAAVAALYPDAVQNAIKAISSSTTNNHDNPDPCPPEACYGPFYRYETDPAYVTQALTTGWLYGSTPQGGAWPAAQAYKKDISPFNSNRLKFCTSVNPAPGTGPLWAYWYQGSPGVINHDDSTVKIPIVPVE